VTVPRETYRLTLEALPDGGAPPIIRLRRFLKAALRSYGLRCTAAVQLHEDSPATAPAPIRVEYRYVECHP
jgi:hypothetical protein